ncbi:MAG: hypothetical protein ACOCYP_01605 [Planctomycetota bacterium]
MHRTIRALLCLCVMAGSLLVAADDDQPELDPEVVARAQAELDRYTAEAEAEVEALSESQTAAVAAITDQLDDARAYLRVRQADAAGTCFITARARFAELDPELAQRAPKVVARLRTQIDALAQELLRDEQLDPGAGEAETEPAPEPTPAPAREPAPPLKEPQPAPEAPAAGGGGD